jgi:hypothetical protein
MDFIEQWFHASPDGGSGALEMLLVLGLPALVALALGRSYILRSLRRYANRPGRRES